MLAPELIETHLMAFEIYYRKEKLLLMLQSIKRAFKCDPLDSRLHQCIVRFLLKVRAARSGNNETVNTVLDKEIPEMIKQPDLEKYNNQYLELNRNSLQAHIAVGKSIYYIDKGNREEALKHVTNLADNLNDVNLEVCADVYVGLKNKELDATPEECENYRQRCSERFPYADIFKSVEAKERSSESNREINGSLTGEG